MGRRSACWLVLTGLLLGGCSQGSGLPLENVTGTVTKGGSPLQGAVVQFQPTEGRASFGRTDSSGAYTLMFTQHEEGALIGEHRVTLRVPQKQPQQIPGFEEMDLDTQEAALETRPVELPSPYEVVDDGDNVFDFEVNDLPK